MASISAIREQFTCCKNEDIPALIQMHEVDARAGVRQLVKSYRGRYERYLKELERLEIISRYERTYYEAGCQYIAGVDEVGRGPLAGPVVACAVILPKGYTLEGVNDSKKLSEKKRTELCAVIKADAIAIGTGIVDVRTIDKINILNATKEAMKIAIENLNPKPEVLLIDALTLDQIPIRQQAIVKGDEKSISIAAASIVAKVSRDAMMKVYGEAFPAYEFQDNKGYGSSRHVAAIKEYGPCPLHRRSFLKNILGEGL